MELKVVYRILRKISDYAVGGGFYSEVHVEGRENVPVERPLIIAASHHNEILDIAALSVTIPHRRHVSFWAKSTMFANPLARAILTSSGSIPVARNPDSTRAPAAQAGDGAPQRALFRATSEALAAGQAVGVFPEGTSYTEPGILQVKEGAAWAAVEYARWVREHNAGKARVADGSAVIVPVGIVYTDKSQYQSRVCVRYGKPIVVDIDDSADDRAKVKQITAKVKEEMLHLTVNAPDWDTIYAARIARDIVWGEDTNISLNKYVHVSQTFIDIFTQSPSSSASLPDVKNTLIAYFSLLHYTALTEPALASLLPDRPDLTVFPHNAVIPFVAQALRTLLHPRFVAFLPPLLAHAPGYLLGRIAARALAAPGEEEAQAQFKVIFGGLGVGAGCATVAGGVVRWLVGRGAREGVLGRLGRILAGAEGRARRWLGLAGTVYGVAWVLVKWHGLLVRGNYRQSKRLLAAYKLMAGSLAPRAADVAPERLALYLRPPPRRVNPFVKPSIAGAAALAPSQVQEKAPPVAAPRLIRPLLAARREAVRALAGYVAEPAVRAALDGALP